MSGFGAITSLAFAVFILIQSYSYLILMSKSLVQTFLELPLQMQQQNNFELQLTRVEENIVYFKLVNKGPRDISVRNLLRSDLFIIYTDVYGVRRTVWLPYSPTDRAQNNTWHFDSVMYGNFPGELVDPIDLSTGLDGIWNVGETLSCAAVLEISVINSLPVYAKFRVVG